MQNHINSATYTEVQRSIHVRMFSFVCKNIVPRGRGHSKTGTQAYWLGPTTYRLTSRLSSSFIVGFPGCHLSQQN